MACYLQAVAAKRASARGRTTLRTYPDAAAQGHNFAMRGVLGAVEHDAITGGALVGHIPGAIIGHVAELGAAKPSDRALLSNVEKRISNYDGATSHAARRCRLVNLLLCLEPFMNRSFSRLSAACWR